jgi:hypothetical protein
VICRAKMPIVDPPIPAHPEAPVIQREMGQHAARSAWPNAVEKLSSRQAALDEQKAPNWEPAVKKLSMVLKDRAVAARALAWARRSRSSAARQMALEERAATARTTATVSECKQTLNTPVGRTTALGTVFHSPKSRTAGFHCRGEPDHSSSLLRRRH